jgi:hypothetical protein
LNLSEGVSTVARFLGGWHASGVKVVGFLANSQVTLGWTLSRLAQHQHLGRAIHRSRVPRGGLSKVGDQAAPAVFLSFFGLLTRKFDDVSGRAGGSERFD